VPEAAAQSQIIALATPWNAVPDAVKACGDLSGKILIDCTNPLLAGLAGLAVGTTTSAAEQLAALAPSAHVVKAFNTVGFNIMLNPVFGPARAVLFYCGDHLPSKKIAHELAADCGFEPADAGPLKQARLLEPFAMLWISLALQQGYGREIAFQLLRR
jgi:hypothetical protein